MTKKEAKNRLLDSCEKCNNSSYISTHYAILDGMIDTFGWETYIEMIKEVHEQIEERRYYNKLKPLNKYEGGK